MKHATTHGTENIQNKTHKYEAIKFAAFNSKVRLNSIRKIKLKSELKKILNLAVLSPSLNLNKDYGESRLQQQLQ